METVSKNHKGRVRRVCMIGVLTALVFAANWISIPIPTMIDSTRIHLGNIMCLLAGFVLGPVGGGLAAGFGGMFYDFTNPLFVKEAWITFLLKFAMAWLCGKIAWSGRAAEGEEETNRRIGRNTIAAIAGALFYVVLYMGKNFIMNYFFLRMELYPVLIAVATKGFVSAINGLIAVLIAVPLNTALQAALERANILYKPAKR